MTLTSARLQLDGALRLNGPLAPVTIARDAFGVPHVSAANEHDAWFGQGFASAQDRLWQMEYDRRRAAGRWAEAAGATAVAGDVLARRLQLARAAKADIGAMSAVTRAMFQAYAEGVNAYLQSGQPLPPEYELTRLRPEPWETWHSVAAFKIRHVLMGVWQRKLALATLLARIGPRAFERLDGGPPLGSVVILPTDGAVTDLYRRASSELTEAAEQLGFLSEVEPGSNSWAVHGSRTATGMPVLCNDSHRALDVPNVYWQAHVKCPTFDVIGATFPGLPAFPHFGHNGHVAWSITHTSADYQDLYVERFDPQQPGRYQTPEGWAEAEPFEETIAVRDSAAVTLEVWRTRHGPVVHGDPREGPSLSLRYTATDEPCRGFEPLRRMLLATTVSELHEAQRDWVDPVNNLVSADTSGNIGYLTRGYLPIRSSQGHYSLPAPGWSGDHEWVGRVPFETLPQAINPAQGFIVTANQKVIPGAEPYISDSFSPPARAERIRRLLTAGDRRAMGEIAAIQGDVTSESALAWIRLLRRSGPFESDAEQARSLLESWDGSLLPDSAAALLYGFFRRALARTLFEPVVGADAWRWLVSAVLPSTSTLISQWMANVIARLDGQYLTTTPRGDSWDVLLPDVLAQAWASACTDRGPNPSMWHWADVHATNAIHPLSAGSIKQARDLDPPHMAVGGDGDTIQAASYDWQETDTFPITGLSVYRQAVDLSDVAHATFVVPGGVSGIPGTAHFVDQLELWRRHERIPMHYDEADVRAAALHTLTLMPP
jgi:penicillin amidase